MIKLFFFGLLTFGLYTMYNNEGVFNSLMNQASSSLSDVVREASYTLTPKLDESDWGQDSGSEVYAVVKLDSGYVPVGWVKGENQCYLASMAMAKKLRKENNFKYDCCTYFDGNRCKSAL